jgi:hypothetical protein
VIFVQPYIRAAAMSPLASRNIYEQQYQMHRFVADYFPHRVAVGDLGWVSFQNPNYVLDLAGLGSEKVRLLRSTGKFDPQSIEQLSREDGIDFAMLYDEHIFGPVPSNWCLVGVLKGESVTSASGDVLFFATRPATERPMRDALDKFVPTLPHRVVFQPHVCRAPVREASLANPQ